MPPRRPRFVYVRMTDEAVAELALAIFKEQVVGTWGMPEEMSGHDRLVNFMPIKFVDMKRLKQMEAAGVMHFYEYLYRAERAYDGKLEFHTCRPLNQVDAKRVLTKVEAIRAAVEKAL